MMRINTNVILGIGEVIFKDGTSIENCRAQITERFLIVENKSSKSNDFYNLDLVAKLVDVIPN